MLSPLHILCFLFFKNLFTGNFLIGLKTSFGVKEILSSRDSFVVEGHFLGLLVDPVIVSDMWDQFLWSKGMEKKGKIEI